MNRKSTRRRYWAPVAGLKVHQNGSESLAVTPMYLARTPPVEGLVGSIRDQIGEPAPNTWQSAVQQAADPSLFSQLGGDLHGGVAPHVWMVTPYSYVFSQFAVTQPTGEPNAKR